MAYICELGPAPEDCYELQAYLEDFIVAAGLIDNFRYGAGTATVFPTPTILTELWAPCDPPDCALTVWWNPDQDDFTIWSYISGTWRQLGTKTGLVTPYYTSFEGDYDLLGDDWLGNWVINGAGQVLPVITLSGTELLLNEDLETWTLATTPDNWTIVGVGSEEVVIVHSGTSAAKITPFLAGTYYGWIIQTVVVTEGRWFVQSAYGRKPTVALPDWVTLALHSEATWLDTLSYITVNDAYEGVSIADYSLNTGGIHRLRMDSTVASTFYADTMSMQEVTAGWNTLKEFYSKAGTFYVDFNLGTANHFGLVLNYQDVDNHTMVLVQDTGTLHLVETVAGVASITNSWAVVYVPNARLEVLRASADTVTIDYNSLNVVTGQALASPNTATQHGMVGLSFLSSASEFGYTPE